MIRRPPRSTLFPYTRSSDLIRTSRRYWLAGKCSVKPEPPCTCMRSEEHTSELQSHSDLVCRLLLEKKNCGYYPSFRSYTPNNNVPRIRDAEVTGGVNSDVST